MAMHAAGQQNLDALLARLNIENAWSGLTGRRDSTPARVDRFHSCNRMHRSMHRLFLRRRWRKRAGNNTQVGPRGREEQQNISPVELCCP